ncbi:SigE family RNA polymerase sigma factor [Crossiella sp. CA198]|uniref:SigE family RNA polymerase sigma factor n=1 Tax=Crossiella sp. CA198 TaxID=3455607 RepID=UPI003F8D585D
MRAAEEQRYTDYVSARLPALRRTAYLLCGDEHRADDVVQATITKLFVHWRRAAAADDLDRYVRAMLVRTFLSEQRLGWAKRIRLVGGSEELPPRAAPAGPDVETRAVVHAALARVAPRARAVLVLRFLLDLPVAEVAELLGCSAGNVKSQTSLGLTALRRLLGDSALVHLGKE